MNLRYKNKHHAKQNVIQTKNVWWEIRVIFESHYTQKKGFYSFYKENKGLMKTKEENHEK
jgi:hypothetical protein